MTIRISLISLLVVGGILACIAISGGVAWVVADQQNSDYVDCIVDVETRYLDQWEPHRAARPEYTGSSVEAYNQYTQQYDKWQEAGDTISQEWVDGMRDCA